MKITFNIEYFTEFGQNLYISGNIPELGSWQQEKAVRMDFSGNGQWKYGINVNGDIKIAYRYLLKDDRNLITYVEWGKPRELMIKDPGYFSLHVKDDWRNSIREENAYYTSAFTDNLWKRRTKKKRIKSATHYNHRFQLYAPRIDADHFFCIIGNEEALGQWNQERAVIMDDSSYPLWTADVFLEGSVKPIQYKYAIFNKKDNRFVSWEEGPNRTLDHNVSVIDNSLVIRTDDNYRHPLQKWRGAGVAIPVFALRSTQSSGVGEFSDLKILIDWAVRTNQRIIQILPVNDTIATHSWTDSYPYAAISVFALHPIYLRLKEMGKLKDNKAMDEFIRKGAELNENPVLDYQAVMELKSRYFKSLYDQDREHFLRDPGFIEFFNHNHEWLVPYAAFSYLRDKYDTPDFSKWEDYAKYDQSKVDQLVDPQNPIYDDVAVHLYIQYHLHRQLKDVADYAREKGIVLKGDLPIGIFRNSVDAWLEPRLYHMDKQAGAPPDAYSISGQNWRFPTYNWYEMAKDNYKWWRRRLSQMAKYFDAYRIDHILGFFRIWEIPWDSVEGLMGVFNPAIPMSRQEIENNGIHFDYDRFCRPYIRDYMLQELFGEFRDEVATKFLDHIAGDIYSLKPEFDTQRKVLEHFLKTGKTHNELVDKNDRIRFGLYTLIGNVLFLEDPGSDGKAFHPKIAFHQTHSYRDLDDHRKNILNGIYTHYFYHRQEDFWADQAMIKLPAITSASDMLVCGEDLGMVPDCVPGVLYKLGILRLFIQRMPKDSNNEFGYPYDAPYLSVISPSCHDMSTVRGWWEEDRERAQRYFNQILGHNGDSPYFCEPWINEEILLQHLNSPAMWAITPLQDLVAMDAGLRRENPQDEQINDPSNPNNLWQYRFHINLEDLLKEKYFNRKLAEMIDFTGRNLNY